MLFAMGAGILGAISLMIVMARLGIRKFMGYPAICDFGVTVLLGILFLGTLGGIAAAIAGGLFFSGAITVLRRLFGWSRYSVRKRKWVVINEGLMGTKFTNLKEKMNAATF